MPQASLVCLTEQLDGIEWLRHNVELNRSRGIPLDNVAVQEADWRRLAADASGSPAAEGSANGAAPAAGEAQLETLAEGASAGGDVQQRQQHGAGHADGPQRSAAGPRDLRATRWDFIVGSDLVYNEVGSRCLPRVLAALASSGTRVLYCHTIHRLDLLDMELFQQLQVCGLHAEEVWEPGAPPPPDSPPLQFPPADLFPEQRIAVYSISRVEAHEGGSRQP